MTVRKVEGCGEVFGVPVGIIGEDLSIQNEKYKTEKVFDKKTVAQGLAGSAVATAAIATVTGSGAKEIGKSAATAGVASVVVAGAVAGVSALHEAVTHQRVTYITIKNLSLREYSFQEGYTKHGYISSPFSIPVRSVVRLAFHNDGPFSGALSFVSDFDFLYIGASNPLIGKNKLQVECTKEKQHLYTYWNHMKVWNTKNDCGRNVFLCDSLYDNPSQCVLEIHEDLDNEMRGDF